MDKFLEVVKRILLLLNTIEEGILHIPKQLEELRYEEALLILQDVMEGIGSIEDAIKPMIDKLPKNNVERLTCNLRETIEKAVSNYIQGKDRNLEKQVKEGILTAFKHCQIELDRTMRCYTIS